MQWIKTSLISGILMLCSWTTGLCADPPDKKVTALYTEDEIVVDGILDEHDWSLAQPATDFIQNDPLMDAPATERTEVRILYDDENLYLGVYCFDSGGGNALVLTDVRRDYNPRESDHFSAIFDTFDDNRNGVVFGSNPGGGKREGQVGTDGAEVNFDWDTIWEVKSQITDSGWQIEMAIPFTSLRFPEGEGQVWGVNFSRRIRRKNEADYWSPIPRPHTREFEDDVDFVPAVGMDVKYGLTPGLTLDLTVNTDFAQVEADQQQINLTRFSLFFPEKRDFFLENANIFFMGKPQRRFGNVSSQDLIPFFSRRIGIADGQIAPILGGARLSGRMGQYTLGLLSLQTAEFEETPSTNFTVLRLRRDLFRNSDVGGIFINKQAGGGQFNRTYGFDANLKFFDYLDIVPFLLKTESPDQPGEDIAANIAISWSDPFWDLLGEYMTIGENFNPEVGFVRRTDIRKTRGKFGVKPRPGERIPWIRQFQPFLDVNYFTDQENILETRTVEGNFSILFENNSNFGFSYTDNFERLDEPFEIRPGQEISIGDYSFGNYSISFNGDRSRMFSANAALQTGGFFDGDKDSYSLGVRFLPNYHFEADVSWGHDDVALPSGDFKTNLVSTRLVYSFNPRMFLNGLIQYNSTVGEIESNIRFNFIYKPLRDFFLVYNERRATTGEVRERALIAKITYVFDF